MVAVEFGANNRFNNFGAAGLAWIFTEEELFKNIHLFYPSGKLKASYGSTGNDQIGDYRYLNLYSPIYGIYQGSWIRA